MSDQSIERFLQRVCQAIDEGDLDFWRTSIAEGALVVGSAPEEVYRGREEVVRAFGSYGPISCQPKAIQGNEQGAFGWAFGDVVVAGVGARLSLVATRPGGAGWQITHWHISVGVPDEEAFSDISTGG